MVDFNDSIQYSRNSLKETKELYGVRLMTETSNKKNLYEEIKGSELTLNDIKRNSLDSPLNKRDEENKMT